MWFKLSACSQATCVEVAFVLGPEFRKSSASTSGSCVEAAFRKASDCGDTSCVEAAVTPEEVLVRDSKDVAGPVLRFTRGEWEAFLAGAKRGEFDLPG
jgi:hypothetical protein